MKFYYYVTEDTFVSLSEELNGSRGLENEVLKFKAIGIIIMWTLFVLGCFWKFHNSHDKDQIKQLLAEELNVNLSPIYDLPDPIAPKERRIKLAHGKFFKAEIKKMKVSAGLKTHPSGFSIMAKETARKLKIIGDLVEEKCNIDGKEYFGWILNVPILFMGCCYRVNFRIIESKTWTGEVSLGHDFLLHYGLYQYFSHGSTYLCDPYGGIEILCTCIAEEPRVFIDGFIKRTHDEDEFVRVNLWNMPGNGITVDVLEKFYVDGDDETKGGKGEASNWRVKMKAGITDTIEAKDIKQVEPRSSCLPGIMIGTNFLAEKEAHIDYRKQLIYIKEDHHYECFALKLEF